jgi:hypothetical protein
MQNRLIGKQKCFMEFQQYVLAIDFKVILKWWMFILDCRCLCGKYIVFRFINHEVNGYRTACVLQLNVLYKMVCSKTAICFAANEPTVYIKIYCIICTVHIKSGSNSDSNTTKV